MSGWLDSPRHSTERFGARRSSIASTARLTADEKSKRTCLKGYGERIMSVDPRIEQLRLRTAALEMTAEQFRLLGHDLVDRIAGFLASISTHPVTRAESPFEVREALGAARALPEKGKDPGSLL